MRKNTACDENREKTRAFYGNMYEILETRFTSNFFFKGQYGSNHIVLSPHPGFRKSGKYRILKDILVQLWTIRFTVFKWTIQFK